jgi:hypothetical protein
MSTPRTLIEIARECEAVIDRAEAAGVTIDDGNVIDLLADNLEREPLRTLQDALVITRHGARFPRATGGRRIYTREDAHGGI